jgi:4,5-dihydroxyphthalate decarboxylase
MAKLQLSLACGDYEIMRPLADGTVKPDGIELTVLTKDRARILQTSRRKECDLAEFNITRYFYDSESDPDLFALPVFPHRRFRLAFIFVNAAAGIKEPRDLIGRSLIIRGERPAAAIWLRGMLNEHFGVPYDQLKIVDPMGFLGEVPASGVAGVGPDGFQSRSEQMLLDGEVDALISAGVPPSFIAGDPRISRLFPDFNDRDIALYRETNIFPIMHAVTIQRSLIERAPWAPINLLRAFSEAKAIAYSRAENPRTAPLGFFQKAWEDQQAILGPDPWVYGMNDANRHNLETILRYSAEQGLVKPTLGLDELFVNLDESKLSRFIGH